MPETRIIYHCPNGCNASLTSDFEVKQTWLVDIDGEPIEPDNSPEMLEMWFPCCRVSVPGYPYL